MLCLGMHETQTQTQTQKVWEFGFGYEFGLISQLDVH
jgi:hypothetical protein